VLHFNKISSIKIVISFFLVIITNTTHSQTILSFTEDIGKAKKTNYPTTTAKSLLIFESEIELSFESSAEILTAPKKTENKYYLEVNPGPQSITIKSKNESINIRFGMASGVINGASLKSKEIKYFKIKERKILKYSDITGNEKAKNMTFSGIGMDPSDAILYLKVSPANLKISIEDPKKVVSKMSPQADGDVIVYIKMKDVDSISKRDIVLNLIDKEYGITEMKIYDLSRSEQRFYSIEKVSDIEKAVTEAVNKADAILASQIKLAEETKNAELAKKERIDAELALQTKKEEEARIAEKARKQKEIEENTIKKNEAKYYRDLTKAEQHPFSNIGYQGGTIAPYGVSYEVGGQSVFGFHISARSTFADEQAILDGSIVENKTEVDLGPSLRLFTNFYLNLGVGYGIYDYKKTNDFGGTSTVEKGGYIESSFGFMKKFGKSINVNAGLSYMDVHENLYKPEVIFGISFNLK
jgi:hypothetical protein